MPSEPFSDHSTDDPIAQLSKAAALRDQGALTEDEFAAIKARLLGMTPSGAATPATPQAPSGPGAKGSGSNPPGNEKRAKVGMALLVVAAVASVLSQVVDSRRPSTLTPAERTATVAARRATWTPRQPSGGNEVSAPRATRTVEPGMEGNPVGVATPVSFGTSSWIVWSVKDYGNSIPSNNQFITSPTTSGKFIEVEVGILNDGSDAMSVLTPKLIDASGWEFDTSSDVYMVIDNQSQCLFETVNPGLTKTCVWIYDVPSDATGLQLAISGSLFGGKRYISVNP